MDTSIVDDLWLEQLASYVPAKKRNSRRYHRLVEKRLGRRLLQDEVVHHKNFKEYDDRPENLQVMSRSEHTRLHIKAHFARERWLYHKFIHQLQYESQHMVGVDWGRLREIDLTGIAV